MNYAEAIYAYMNSNNVMWNLILIPTKCYRLLSIYNNLYKKKEDDSMDTTAIISESKNERKRKEISISDKRFWSLEEAAICTGIGVNKLRDISNDDNCRFVLWIGSRRMLKRDKLLEYLDSCFSI